MAEPEATRRVHVHIRGRVQGVALRHYTRETARQLALSGWVRNLADGGVEAVAEGSGAALEQFVRWCRKGPPAARVTDLDAVDEPVEGLSSFEIRY